MHFLLFSLLQFLVSMENDEELVSVINSTSPGTIQKPPPSWEVSSSDKTLKRTKKTDSIVL